MGQNTVGMLVVIMFWLKNKLKKYVLSDVITTEG